MERYRVYAGRYSFLLVSVHVSGVGRGGTRCPPHRWAVLYSPSVERGRHRTVEPFLPLHQERGIGVQVHTRACRRMRGGRYRPCHASARAVFRDRNLGKGAGR